MWKFIGAVMLAATVIFGGSPAMQSAVAAEAASAIPATATGAGAQRRHHQHYAYRPYYPYYYGRPYYYSPGPFFLPDAPSWARGWDQWWW